MAPFALHTILPPTFCAEVVTFKLKICQGGAVHTHIVLCCDSGGKKKPLLLTAAPAGSTTQLRNTNGAGE